MHSPKAQPASPAETAAVLHRDFRGPGWGVLTWLAEAGFLTNDQVALRFYPTPQGVRSATYRMAQLADWGLVARRRMRTQRQVWHLSAQGAHLVADYLRSTPREIGYDGKEAFVHEAFVRHSLAVTQLEVALLIHAARHGGEVLSFAREPRLQTEAGPMKPDALFVYSEGARTWTYTLELDRNTETPAYFAATKAPKYDALAHGNWQLYCEQIPTCLVVITDGRDRVSRLKAVIDALPVSAGDFRLYKFVNAEHLYHTPSSHQGLLPETETHFADPVCLAARKPDSERRAVFG